MIFDADGVLTSPFDRPHEVSLTVAAIRRARAA